jgi:hypothetical protein
MTALGTNPEQEVAMAVITASWVVRKNFCEETRATNMASLAYYPLSRVPLARRGLSCPGALRTTTTTTLPLRPPPTPPPSRLMRARPGPGAPRGHRCALGLQVRHDGNRSEPGQLGRAPAS